VFIGHFVMIRTKHNQVINIVSAAMPPRYYVMHVNDCVPSANHTGAAEIPKGVISRRGSIACATEIRVFVSRYVNLLIFWPKARSEGTRPAAIFRLCRAVWFGVVGLTAALARLFDAWELARFKWQFSEYLGLGLVRASPRTIVFSGFSLRRLTVKNLAAHGAHEIGHSLLLSLGGTLARTIALSTLSTGKCARVLIKLLPASCTNVCFHKCLSDRGLLD